MEPKTLIACNRRYIVSAVGDRVSTRRTNDSLTPLKPDFLGHKGEVTHLAIHQPDNCYGTQDDWGRVVASSDDTNRVKVWLCDGEEEELMFARNMAEYVGYEKITAVAWTGDSKVAIGDAVGNYIVFNARYATSRYNRTVSKAITSIAPSQTDPHIHALGYEDGSILLIRTNPSFQIIFTNNTAHTGPIASLAWRPEFSAPRTYTEKDGKVHKSSAEDMALLASCPSMKGEFRIWAWSSKAEKLTAFRDEHKNPEEENDLCSLLGQLHWSRNGKVVQFLQGEVRIWDVRKLQIQSELFLSSSENILGIAVDGHRGLLYTLDTSGVKRHTIPAKAASQPTSIPIAVNPAGSATSNDTKANEPVKVQVQTTDPLQVNNPTPTTSSPVTPEPPKAVPEKIHINTDVPAIPDISSSAVDSLSNDSHLPISLSTPVHRTPSAVSIDSLSRVKQMAKQFDEDPGLAKKKNNFIANAKAKYSFERRKRTVSNDSEYASSRDASPEPGMKSGGTQGMRHPSIFEIATGGGVKGDVGVSRLPVRSVERKGSSESGLRVTGSGTCERSNSLLAPENKSLESSRSPTPEAYLRKDSISKTSVEEPVLSSDPPVTFKPVEYTTKPANTQPMKVVIPDTPKQETKETAQSGAQEIVIPPLIERARQDSLFLESPILGDLVSETPDVSQVCLPTPTSPDTPPSTVVSPTPLHVIPEETPAMKIVKSETDLQPELAILGLASHLNSTHVSNRPEQPKYVPSVQMPPKITEPTFTISSTPSSSASSNLAEPMSSYEDLGGISMDDQDDMHNDARSDTSVEPMADGKPASPNSITVNPAEARPTTPELKSQVSPTIVKSPPSRASKIWAEKNGKNIHTKIVDYLSDGEEPTPSPMFKSQPAPPKPVTRDSSDSDIRLDSPTPYKHSLRDYDLFRSLSRKMSQGSKERLDLLMSTKPLSQKSICKAFFGFDSASHLIQEELKYANELNIGLSELLLKLWLGKEVDDESLLKAILFGKTNGLSDTLVMSLAPLAGIEVWESLMLWCSEINPSKSDLSCDDIIKGNKIVRVHIFAAFLYYNGSLKEAIEIYRKAKMYREAILMAMLDIRKESIVKIVQDLFRAWGDQIAAEDGDGLLVSMCFAASMLTYESLASSRKQSTIAGSPDASIRSASPEVFRPQKASDAMPSPVIPVIRTQKPSPTEVPTSATSKLSSAGPGSPRNWAELATFMRKQREKGFTEIRQPKTVQFAKEDSPSPTGSPSPYLPRPRFPEQRGGSRPSSPSNRRPTPPRRYRDDEDWSRPPRPIAREYGSDRSERALSPSPGSRRPTPPQMTNSGRNSPMPDPSRRRGQHEMSSALAFGARGASIKPSTPNGQDPPPLPIKDEKREKMNKRELRKVLEGEKSRYPEVNGNGVGLGINGHGVRERVARV